MRRLAVLLLLVAPLPFAALSGCVDCIDGPPVTARGIASGDADAGLTGYRLEVLVTDGPGGPPLPGAAVVVYWASQDVADWRGPRVEVGPDRVLVEPFNGSATVQAKTVRTVVTDAQGTVRVRAPGEEIVGIVAAKDGHTEEWLPAVATGAPSGGGRVVMPLYKERLVVDMEAVWGPGGASSGTVTGNNYLWDPHPAEFAEGEDAQRGYAARIVELTVSVTWTNAPTAFGDLAVGVGPPGSQPSLFRDAGDDVTPGAKNETATLTLEDLAQGNVIGSPAVHVGAASDSGYTAPFGLPYQMHVEARFDPQRAALGDCATYGSEGNSGPGARVPGFELVALLGAGALVATLIRRR